MNTVRFSLKPLASAVIALAVLTACGGGGGDSGTSGNATAGGTNAGGSGNTGDTGGTGGTGGTGNTGGTGGSSGTGGTDTSASMTMSCIEGGTFQCSGGTILRTENGIGLTRSGVQVYGKSTGDFSGGASGLAPATEGVAELRIAKDAATGAVSSPALLLNGIGISWDGRRQRPQIIEVFDPTAGRTVRDANGALKRDVGLPGYSDLGFYDYATLRVNGTQANYANNRYFPRSGNPARCPQGRNPCDVETAGVASAPGDWRTNVNGRPDTAMVQRFHEDGDVHAGNDTNGGSLPEGSGTGVPFAGSKGYRQLNHYGFTHANLGFWITQDTVDIAEWTGGNGFVEHNQIRQGVIAYGNVTLPSAVPVSGTARYVGKVYGWYVPSSGPNEDPRPFSGTAVATVDFATGDVIVALSDTRSDDSAMTSVPASLTGTLKMGAAGRNESNYMTGQVSNASLAGGLSGRYFGPVSSGGSGTGPQELGGAIRLSNAGGAAVIGGFIARKQ